MGKKYTICPDGISEDGQDLTCVTVSCSCGWKGHVGQLLGEDEDDTLWCPQCQGAGWTYD